MKIHIRFDGPPSHDSGRFVEVEDEKGRGMNAGEWVQDGAHWILKIDTATLDRPPHCDDLVLHAPGECEFCDKVPHLQTLRARWGINFTGKNDPNKSQCPAEKRRSVQLIHRWPGNRPTTEAPRGRPWINSDDEDLG